MLVLERRFAHGNAWGLPGGILARGEQPLIGLVREFREETGLDLVIEELLSVEGGNGWVHICYLSRVPEGEPKIQVSEHVGYRWIDPTLRELDTDVYTMMPVRTIIGRLRQHEGGRVSDAH